MTPTYWMTFPDGRMILADTLAGLIAEVIDPKYPTMSSIAQNGARLQWLRDFAVRLQAEEIERGLTRGRFSWASCTGRELTRLNAEPGEKDLFPGEPWVGGVPLVRVHSGQPDYAPVDGAMTMDGRDERLFLNSLRRTHAVKEWGDLTRPGRDEGRRRRGVRKENATASSCLYWAELALEGELVIAATLEGLVEAVIGPKKYDPRLTLEQRLHVREEFCIQYAAEKQAGLIDAGIADGSFSWASAWDDDADLLRASKSGALGSGLLYRGTVPLVVVRPLDAETGWLAPGPAPP